MKHLKENSVPALFPILMWASSVYLGFGESGGKKPTWRNSERSRVEDKGSAVLVFLLLQCPDAKARNKLSELSISSGLHKRMGDKCPWSETKRASLQESRAHWIFHSLHIAPWLQVVSPSSRKDVCTQLVGQEEKGTEMLVVSWSKPQTLMGT